MPLLTEHDQVPLFPEYLGDARVLDSARDLLTYRLVGSRWHICVPGGAPSIGDG
jgi:hypothetical protein